MIIGIASDHRGFKLKEKLKKYFKKKKIEFIDYGTDSGVLCDYNDYAIRVCDAINAGEITYGILICGTGIGMSICANKVPGIMCAKVDSAYEAKVSKMHNNANVISFSGEILFLEAKDIVDTFLKSSFSDEERYSRRINKIKELENRSHTKKKEDNKKCDNKEKEEKVGKEIEKDKKEKKTEKEKSKE